MSRSSLLASKAELVGLLWASNAPAFTVPSSIDAASIHVYDHEPRSPAFPISITVATAGMDPESWVLAVRIYVSTVKTDAKVAQDQLDALLPEVDHRIGSNGGYSPSAWEITWDPDLDALVATNLLNVGREDMGTAAY